VRVVQSAVIVRVTSALQEYANPRGAVMACVTLMKRRAPVHKIVVPQRVVMVSVTVMKRRAPVLATVRLAFAEMVCSTPVKCAMARISAAKAVQHLAFQVAL
jgi:hypothetical protein